MAGFRTTQQKEAKERATFHLICLVKGVGYLIAQFPGRGGRTLVTHWPPAIIFRYNSSEITVLQHL